jgi:hypothetical protein
MDEERKKETKAREEAFKDKLSKPSKQLSKAAEHLESAAMEICAKLTMVSNTTSQLETTANTYKDALMKVPTQLGHAKEESGKVDLAVGRSADRKSRQVLINFTDD